MSERVFADPVERAVRPAVGVRDRDPLAVPGTQPFDGRPWHVSTGNLSVTFIQGSPIGAFPRANNAEAPPSVESLYLVREPSQKSRLLCLRRVRWHPHKIQFEVRVTPPPRRPLLVACS